MDYYSSRKPGNILSAFCPENDKKLPERYITLKKEIAKTTNDLNRIGAGWNRLIKAFEEETKIIKQLGPNVIPQIDFSKILQNGGTFPDSCVSEIKKRGCVVIKNVVDPEVALKYKKDIQDYIGRHPGEIAGFPENNPQVWEIYWSKSQLEARSHPNFDMACNALNNLWKADKDTEIDLSKNVTYCDRLRIRQPQDTSFDLAEHMDGGSVERWEDPEYRSCYSEILKGQWENYDAFDATHRVHANMDMHNCIGGCSMFRTFQGWMSLSTVKPGGGTLRLCPLIKYSTACLILRPLLPDLIDTTDMAGAIPAFGQNILKDLHPHIVDSVVSVPEVNPGDCVFWHCDCVHAVEQTCGNLTDSSVLYIPATPLCSKNAEYLLKQRRAFELGYSAPDFPSNNCELEFKDRGTPDELSELGKIGMGFKQFESKDTDSAGAKQAVFEANRILFGVSNDKIIS